MLGMGKWLVGPFLSPQQSKYLLIGAADGGKVLPYIMHGCHMRFKARLQGSIQAFTCGIEAFIIYSGTCVWLRHWSILKIYS